MVSIDVENPVGPQKCTLSLSPLESNLAVKASWKFQQECLNQKSNISEPRPTVPRPGKLLTEKPHANFSLGKTKSVFAVLRGSFGDIRVMDSVAYSFLAFTNSGEFLVIVF